MNVDRLMIVNGYENMYWQQLGIIFTTLPAFIPLLIPTSRPTPRPWPRPRPSIRIPPTQGLRPRRTTEPLLTYEHELEKMGMAKTKPV